MMEDEGYKWDPGIPFMKEQLDWLASNLKVRVYVGGYEDNRIIDVIAELGGHTISHDSINIKEWMANTIL